MPITHITIGWTLNSRSNRDYSSFADGYRTGAPQHTETVTVDLPGDTDPLTVAEHAFVATNAPYLAAGSPAWLIAEAITWNGWTDPEGDLVGHYSLSVGDTVTVNGRMFACENLGWSEVTR